MTDRETIVQRIAQLDEEIRQKQFLRQMYGETLQLSEELTNGQEILRDVARSITTGTPLPLPT